MTAERHTVNKHLRRAGELAAKPHSIPSWLWERVGWDSEKARQNAAKHGVSFVNAEDVVRDPLSIVTTDVAHSVDEERYRATGMTEHGCLLVVVFAVDPRGIIRLISARRPTRRERHDYEGGP